MAEDTIKKSLKYSVYDGVSFAVMEGMTSSFLTPFAVALNASVSMIAALTYVPQLLGAFVQLFTSKLVELIKDKRKILFAGSFMHAILWLPLLLIPYLTPNHKYLIIIYVSLQTILVQIMNPIWNSLMGDLVPKYERGRFFGVRNRVIGATSFIAALIAGLILNHYSPKHPFLGFTILFCVAFIARLLCGVFKAMIQNPKAGLVQEEKFSIFDFVKRMEKTNYGHFVMYIVLFKFAVYISSPFFAVYMLKNLGFSYLQFTIVTTSGLVASFTAMGIWGKLIDSKGTKYVLYVSGMLTPVIPIFWVFSHNFYYLAAVEFFSGIAWAGFNLSASNFIFDAVRPENRVRCIAYYRFFEGIAVFAGSLLGGFLINTIPPWIFISSIPFVFLISGILRILVSLILLPTLKEARLIEMDIGHAFFKKYVIIRPSEGLVYEVIGKYKKYERLEDKAKKTKDIPFAQKRKAPDKKESEAYKKKLMRFIDKEISPKKEEHQATDMHEVENITQDIEKGKGKG